MTGGAKDECDDVEAQLLKSFTQRDLGSRRGSVATSCARQKECAGMPANDYLSMVYVSSGEKEITLSRRVVTAHIVGNHADTTERNKL